jgi:uncharacterized protein
MLVDANVLLYAVDRRSTFHSVAKEWLTGALNGTTRVGIPWMSLVAFIRISTHPRASPSPLTPDDALRHVTDWLAAEPVWVPSPGPRHAEVLARLVTRADARGGLVSDAHLAAIAVEHGLTVISADSDFARFAEVRWSSPFR